MHRLTLLTLPCGLLALSLLLASSEPSPAGSQDKPYSPKIFPASNEGLLALKRIAVPGGLKVDLFAAEPLLANPVAFCIDEKGRFYVAETFRLHAGVTDNRGHMYWLDDELACRTVADRVAMYKKHLGKRFDSYEREHDRVRLVEDTDGDGTADKATVFADGFNTHASGIGSGVLARRGDVYYTCIPDLWLLRDTKGAGKADVKKSLHYGYGVHVAFIGHDLHGLKFGPDGRLYFSVGDRGLHVATAGRTVSAPDTGCVLRCNADGSELEIVATGLRNPQELAFDKYGNLFTGDNNADSGDLARWVHVVEGGDSGWRIGYQYLKSPAALGPWNAEKLWHLAHQGQAAYLLPPLAHVGAGPSGLTYHPGVSLLPERYRDHFFLADFRGGPGNSGIRAFTLKPSGATFSVVGQEQFAWSILATDCDFGPDGGFYLSDWVEGWGRTGKGRIYKVHDPGRAKDPLVAEVRKLLGQGMEKRTENELLGLLAHPDMRVRQETQFALAEKGVASVEGLAAVAKRGKDPLARLHALWGLGQVGRMHPAPVKKALTHKEMLALAGDKDTEVRAQLAKVLGEVKVQDASDRLRLLLKDTEPRVRFFAAMSLGKLGKGEAIPDVLEMLRKNADSDAYLRHAGVMALTWINDRKALHAAAQDSSAAVRMAALLAMRRLEMPEVARFLGDADARLQLEAARAVYDVPIPAALPQLAALAERTGLTEPLLYRAASAHFRLGKPDNATALARLAARPNVPERVRVEALTLLGQWEKPSGRDRVIGLWRPVAPRPAAAAAAAVRAALGGLFTGPARVRTEAARVAARLGIKEVGPALMELALDKSQPAQVRVETLRALEALGDRGLQIATDAAITDADPRLRSEGRRVYLKREPGKAGEMLGPVLERGEMVERQGAFAILGDLKDAAADRLLSDWLDRLREGKVAAEVRLDLLEAAAKRPAQEVKDRLARYEAARAKDDPLAKYRETLVGGDAEAGRRIFLHKSEVSCLRCHKVNGEGGAVGPDLTGIGAKQTREYLLEALVEPNRQIAKGYETLVLTLTNGQIRTGILKSEDAREVRLMTPEGTVLVVPRDQIDERARGRTAMPEDVTRHLSRHEMRDLVEFLAGLK